MNKILTAGLVGAVLTGCTVTPQGKSVDRANYADMASTALALTVNSGASEANPLGLALIPLKVSMGYVLEKKYPDNCFARASGAQVLNSVFYGATVNNLAIAASASGAVPIVLGVAAGVAYYNMRYTLEPEVYECMPESGPMRTLAIAYAKGSVEGVEEAFAEQGVDAGVVGRGAIGESYGALFATSDVRRMWFLNGDTIVTQVDDHYTKYNYKVTVVDGEITDLEYTQVPTEET